MPPSTASTEEFRAWMATLSMTTMLAATLVHWIGTAAGVATGILVAVRRDAPAVGPWAGLCDGRLVFLGGIANAIQPARPFG